MRDQSLPAFNLPFRSRENALAGIEQELLGEKASSLGDAGRAVERTLAALRDAASGQADRQGLLREAADAVQAYFIQREACGLRRHQDAIAHYGIPGEILARLGAR